MKVRALVLASQGKLRDCGIENPARDARLMLANCLGVEVHRLNLLDDSFPSEDELSKLMSAAIGNQFLKLLVIVLSGVGILKLMRMF